jgi:hypothetical protein
MEQKTVVKIQKQDATLLITSSQRKSYYNQSNLYEILKSGIFNINHFLNCHLVVYPYISVAVVARDAKLLDTHKDAVIAFIEKTLFDEREK